MFITFEGGDGSGKTTLISSIEQTLINQGHQVLVTRAPGGTPLGLAIRKLLLDHNGYHIDSMAELFLFLADRAQHVEEVIKPSVQAGIIVLCDRYNDSTIAYQSAARGLDKVLVKQLCAYATRNLAPELTLCLDIDPKCALERVHGTRGTDKDRIESENLNFHNQIRKAYQDIAVNEPNRFKLIDASLSKEAVYQQGITYVNTLF